ncbi:MAG: tRNA uridine-5-carboxymethylaminomethyl(34) synthesis GTPase MnmE [Fidelibacterota bacterium]|nr:MAG: tRNA uridine-5-carboxymethylaminomethyl(34) synthesis GTPase MnmE [Candidatus Neomarinimicrobiota bacterium]
MAQPTEKIRPSSQAEKGPIGYSADTIVAQATPPGRGGVAVLRISGPQALPIAQRLSKTPLSGSQRHAQLVEIVSAKEEQLLDKALITYYKAPASFTGEDVVEISTHGGHVTPARIIRTITELGARLAGPGEFSLRAFLNGKMNLAEAEALNQMISSLSRRSQAAATENLTGRLTREIEAVRDSLIELLTIIEHELDFSEDEIDLTSTQEMSRALNTAIARLQHLQDTAPYGRIIRDGVRVILAGPPNAGKSSLFNALIGHERAIVTDIPGTTRDSLEAWIDVDGFPVCLVDTAGLCEGGNTIEQISITRSRQQLARADIVLVLDPDNPEAVKLEPETGGKTVMHIKSKADESAISGRKDIITSSIMREDGLDNLIEHLKAALHSYIPQHEGAIIASERQLHGLTAAVKYLEGVKEQLQAGQPIDILSGEIRLAVNSLAEIIGETTSEEVIQRIFSEFCVGK